MILASGMCEAERILHHLRNNIENPRNTILFVGYCAQNTLGWKICEGHEEVRISGDEYKGKANIDIMDSFSRHADHSELIDYFHKIKGSKKKVWLVHGRPVEAKHFARRSRKSTMGNLCR